MDKISSTLSFFIETKSVSAPKETDSYKKEDHFLFVQNTNHFMPYSKGDLKNIIYTIINSGWERLTFYCPSEYTSCISDMKEISLDQESLTHLNNFVHPYHSFSNLKTSLLESGEITIQVERLYTDSEINQIEEKINHYMKSHIREEMSTYDKIKTFHDYIISITKYDITRNETGESEYRSFTAYGPLINGYATCNGYTDVMAIFLSKLNIPNYKIATTPTKEEEKIEGHVWNAVFLDDKWLHLDLTWDDPVSNDGKDYLQHNYFLIDNEELEKADQGAVEVLEHQFVKSIYLEFNEKKYN